MELALFPGVSGIVHCELPCHCLVSVTLHNDFEMCPNELTVHTYPPKSILFVHYLLKARRVISDCLLIASLLCTHLCVNMFFHIT